MRTRRFHLRPRLHKRLAYDDADRLTTAHRSGDTQGFGWDGVHNRRTVTRNGQAFTAGHAGDSNRLSSFTGPGVSRTSCP